MISDTNKFELPPELIKLLRKTFEEGVEAEPEYNRYAVAIYMFLAVQTAIAEILGES